MSLFTDSFTNTNGTSLETHDSNWSQDETAGGTLEIQSNQLKAPSFSSGVSSARYTGVTPNSDHYAKINLSTLASRDFLGVCVRYASAQVDYCVYEADDGTGPRRIYEVVAGVRTQLASTATGDPVQGDDITLEVEGSTLTPKINGADDTDLGTATTALTGGQGGVSYNSGNVSASAMDNFEVGNLGGGGGGTHGHYYRRRRAA